MSDADIIVEAVFERMDVKQDLFKNRLTAKPGAILATKPRRSMSTRSPRRPGARRT